MRFPWTKRKPPELTLAEKIAEAERLEELEQRRREREEKLERQQQEIRREAEWRAERILAIPPDLSGFRLANGCTCGAEEKWTENQRKAFGLSADAVVALRPGSFYSSAGIYHEPDCDRMTSLFVSILEVDGPPPKPWLEEQNLLAQMSEMGVA